MIVIKIVPWWEISKLHTLCFHLSDQCCRSYFLRLSVAVIQFSYILPRQSEFFWARLGLWYRTKYFRVLSLPSRVDVQSQLLYFLAKNCFTESCRLTCCPNVKAIHFSQSWLFPSHSFSQFHNNSDLLSGWQEPILPPGHCEIKENNEHALQV